MAQNFKKFHFLKHFTLQFKAIGFCCTHTPKVFVIRILGQKFVLNIPYESLNFFFFRNKVLDFFLRLGRNFENCSNLTCYP